MNAIAKPADLAGKQYQKATQAVKNGQASLYTMYQAASHAKKQSSAAHIEFSALQIPDGLPKEIHELLSESKEYFGLAYFTKQTALDYILKYMDDKKMSDLQKSENDIEIAGKFIFNGALNLAMAKEKLGILETNK